MAHLNSRFRSSAVFSIIAIVIVAALALCACSGSSASSSTSSSPSKESQQSSSSSSSAYQQSSPSPSKNGALHVQGTQLVDASNTPVQLKGVSTHGLAWFGQYVNEECFSTLKRDWKCSVIRLALYTAESGGYCADGDKTQLMELIDRGVRYATNQDMYVIVDWHTLSDNNPNMHLDEAKAFFNDISARYANNNNVIYEICNEPNGSTSWGDVKSYASEVINVIRAHDNDAVILVGTPNFSQGVDAAAESPLDGFSNIMYTLHFYAATHRDDLRARLSAALDAGLPVFVSEFGICDASGNGAIDAQSARAWIDLLNERGVSYVAWNLSNKDESAAMLRPDCDKLSGFTIDDLSISGTWVYDILTGTDAGSPSGLVTGSKSAADLA